MSDTINELYQKYTENVGMALEDDRYFQYLFAMLESSQNTLSHNHQVLHKVVDERWLNEIEDVLDSINKIIEKPRRFITTTEEVVPVALAKKITADSVRHLSMNTQFIASDENGEIQPTRILNVSTEESYDLYENRFIYHLIQRLVTFIDKRTDVIFWSTGDETSNTMTMESHIDDAYEQISYKIEMTVKNNQSFVENDSDNMNIFMRIDHIRRLVMALKSSSFCDIMNGCSKVRSPIQRTNLLMKDPDYKKCYKLWQFLENYDDVGYYIDVQKTPIEYDEEYMIQMYTNMITNYTVFKSIIEGDGRNVNELMPTKHKVIKPKFVKKIKEEIVDSRDIEEVEIRKVFLEEVTEAQLAAEAKALELSNKLAEMTDELEDTQDRANAAAMQVGQLMQAQMELSAELEEEKEARANAEGELSQLTADAEAAILEAEENYNAMVAEKDNAYASMVAEKDSVYASMVAEKDSVYASMVADKDNAYSSMVAEKDYEKAAEIQRINSEKTDEIQRINSEKAAELAARLAEKDTEKETAISQIINEKALELAQMVNEKESAYATMVADKDNAYATMVAEKDNAYATMVADKDNAFATMVADKDNAFATMVAEKDNAFAAMKAEKDAEKVAAVEKSEAEKMAALESMEAVKAAEIESIVNKNEAAYTAMVADKDQEIAMAANQTMQLQAMIEQLQNELASARKQAEKSEAKYNKLKKKRRYAKIIEQNGEDF